MTSLPDEVVRWQGGHLQSVLPCVTCVSLRNNITSLCLSFLVSKMVLSHLLQWGCPGDQCKMVLSDLL